MRMALWHEGGLGDVIDSAHLAIALRQAHKPEFLAYYLRRPIQSHLAAHLRYDGKPVFDGVIETDTPWELCVKREGYKWDRFIDWKPYVPVEYASPPYSPPNAHDRPIPKGWRTKYLDKPFVPIPYSMSIAGIRNPTPDPVEREIPQAWRLCYRDMFDSPYLNALHTEALPLHEIACKALDIEPVPIDEMEIALPKRVRWPLRLLTALPYITLGTGSDTQRDLRQPQTKEWADEGWEETLRLLKLENPHLRVLQLGKAGETSIKGATSLIGKTSLEELLCILSRSKLHMACENGTVRLARACGVDSVVVFGPTSTHLYGMEGNIPVQSRACQPCFWKKRDWMLKCPNGWDALCMTSLRPKDVAEAVSRKLEKDALNDAH